MSKKNVLGCPVVSVSHKLWARCRQRDVHHQARHWLHVQRHWESKACYYWWVLWGENCVLLAETRRLVGTFGPVSSSLGCNQQRLARTVLHPFLDSAKTNRNLRFEAWSSQRVCFPPYCYLWLAWWVSLCIINTYITAPPPGSDEPYQYEFDIYTLADSKIVIYLWGSDFDQLLKDGTIKSVTSTVTRLPSVGYLVQHGGSSALK